VGGTKPVPRGVILLGEMSAMQNHEIILGESY